MPGHEVGIARASCARRSRGSSRSRDSRPEEDDRFGERDVHDYRRTETDTDADAYPGEERRAHALGFAESFGLTYPVTELLSIVCRFERPAGCIAVIAARNDISSPIADARGCSRCSSSWERWVLDRVRDPRHARARTWGVVRAWARSIDRFATREATLNIRPT
jgi:hypothetical protein